MSGPLLPRSSGSEHSRTARQRRWLVAAVVVCGVALVAITGVALRGYLTADHVGYLDNPEVVEPIDQACRELLSDLDALPAADAGAATMQAQDEAVQAMLTKVRAIGATRLAGDHPALLWIEDWEALLTVRADAQERLRAGQPAAIIIPTDDAHPITQRMSEQVSGCTVPDTLLTIPHR